MGGASQRLVSVAGSRLRETLLQGLHEEHRLFRRCLLSIEARHGISQPVLGHAERGLAGHGGVVIVGIPHLTFIRLAIEAMHQEGIIAKQFHVGACLAQTETHLGKHKVRKSARQHLAPRTVAAKHTVLHDTRQSEGSEAIGLIEAIDHNQQAVLFGQQLLLYQYIMFCHHNLNI